MHSFRAVGILWEVKVIFFYLLSFLKFLLSLTLTGSALPFSNVYVSLCTRITQIDFTWACGRVTLIFCEFKILPLLLSESSQQIFCFVRRKIKFSFYFFFRIFGMFYYLFYLPLATFSSLMPLFLHLHPYLVFLILTQVTRQQNYKVLLFFLGTGGLSFKSGLPKGPFILLPMVWEFCLFLTYVFLIAFKNLAIPHDAVTFVSLSPCYLLNQIFFLCLIQRFITPCSLNLT